MQVELKSVSKRYQIGDGELSVLEQVSFTFPERGAVALMGRSGVGKSTLLHLLGGLDAASDGQVLFDDVDIGALEDEELARFRGRHIGFVFQFHHLLPEFTSLENVAMPLVISKVGRDEAYDRAREMLSRVGLTSRIDHLPGQLSGGEQQRVALARALVGKPDVILADEPTGNLDAETADSIKSTLLELNRELGNTLIVVTHSHELAQSMDVVAEMGAKGALTLVEG